jgi:formate dehydrogenase major subunit
MRTKNAVLYPTDTLQISPEDAELLRLVDGRKVRIRSRYGEAMLPVKINPAITLGELFATFHTAEVFLNNVTGPYRDSYVGAPEYKVTAVAIENIS